MRLLSMFDSIEEILELNASDVECIEGLNKDQKEALIKNIYSPEILEQKYKCIMEAGVRCVSIDDDDYPYRLLEIQKPPIILYVKGHLPLEEKKCVSIVGARNCSPYGKTFAKEIAYSLSCNDVEVISGLARGIDGYAHEGALMGDGNTYGILACGVDIIYPEENRELYNKMICNGGVISEAPMHTPPEKFRFPMRNRIISGISDVTIIIEAREKSGSLITADYALNQGKDVYALPGRLDDPLSAGCNQLIRQGAGIISSVPDLLENLGIVNENKHCLKPRRKIRLEKEELMVYSCLRLNPIGVDEISNMTGLKLIDVIRILASLCDKGFAEEYFINRFIRST